MGLPIARQNLGLGDGELMVYEFDQLLVMGRIGQQESMD